MFDDKTLKQTRRGMEKWLTQVKEAGVNIEQERRFSTISDLDIKPIYTPDDIRELDFETGISYPGDYPFTRGCQATGYRGRVWTFRMFSGFGSAHDTNKRWHRLLEDGETGLSTAFDFPTLMGYDTDSPRATAECGKCGVAIDTLADFEILADNIPMDKVTTSMTINPPASVLWAMYLVAAEKQGVGWDKVGGTIQKDMLKEFIAQKTLMCPPEPSVRLISDTVEFGTSYVPRWNTISISGYHIREAGSTAIQELAFTLADGIAYVQDIINRKKLDVDAFAPRLSFFFNSHIDFFEEIAKFRAARRMWAKIMRDNEALELLANREYGSEAGIVLRAMFEAVVNLLWISKDPEIRLKRYTAYQLFDSQKYRDMTAKGKTSSNFTDTEIEQIETDFKRKYQDAQKIGQEFGFKKGKHWSGKGLKEMAKEIGWSERYGYLYKIYSDITHSNILSLRDYVTVDSSGSMRVNIQPQIEHCKACLSEAYVYLVTAFGFLDVFLDLNMEAVVDKAFLRIPKV